MRITIIGGGNIGTLMAAEIANKGHEVTVYTSKPSQWEKDIDVFDSADNKVLSGQLYQVTNRLDIAVRNASIIWVVVPAQLFADLAREMVLHVKPGQKIGIVPGSGGAEFAFHELIEKGCILFGLQRVHSIARLKEYGKSVYLLGRKSDLQLGAIPAYEAKSIADFVSELFEMPCVALPNYLSVTLTPSNPILHTTRLYSMFHNYEEGVVYQRNFLFYEEWDNESSEILIACDEELQEFCRINPLDLTSVKSLRLHYESSTPEALTNKISGIAAFKGMKSPMIQSESGWKPDFTHRYFVSDFSFGLKVLIDICNTFSVPTPNMIKVWNWYVGVNPIAERESFHLNIMASELLEMYL